MSRGSHIAAIGGEKSPPNTLSQPAIEAESSGLSEETWLGETWDGDEPAPRDFPWAIPALFVAAIVVWTGFYGYAQRNDLLDGGTPSEWTDWIVAWSVPVLLIIGVWLLVLRTSTREAARFGSVSRLLSDESARLESRLITVNRELSLARDFIAAQSRDLESLGRLATERLTASADRLSGLIQHNTAQVETISTVSTTALENMSKLRDDLPVIANSARDVTSQIGNAGRNAHGQLEELISGFHRLNTFGEASERQVEALQARVQAALSELDDHCSDLQEAEAGAISALEKRITALRRESEGFAAELRSGEGEALDKWNVAIATMRETLGNALAEISEIDGTTLERSRNRLKAVGEWAKQVDSAMEQSAANFTQSIEARRRSNALREEEEAAALEQRLAEFDAAIAGRQEVQIAQMATLTEQSEGLAARLDELSSRMETITARGGHIGGELAQAIEQLSARLGTNRSELASTEQTIASLTEASVRLLELIQAGATHSREQLPQAIAEAQDRLDHFESQARATTLLLNEAGEKSEELAAYVLTAQRDGTATLEQVEEIQSRISEQNESHIAQVEVLRAILADLFADTDALSQRANGDLTNAVTLLQTALRNAVSELETGSEQAVTQMAERIGEQSSQAIDRAIRLRTAEAIGVLEQSAAHASGVSREAARQLRDQLAKVDELAGNLENRVQRARERAEEQVDNDFARRVALITESLNSNAIDIAKALSNDVTDTAWASYLRGDRGIFTRRAVRLLDNSEAREITEIYEQDSDFREHVSRYIHDFEAMLRTMLSTRDGNALGVTLLSSDMGKLYVVLAQAIDRLRA